MFHYMDEAEVSFRDGGAYSGTREQNADVAFVQLRAAPRQPTELEAGPTPRDAFSAAEEQLERLVDRSKTEEVVSLYPPTPQGIERAIQATPVDGVWEERVDWGIAEIRSEDMGVVGAMKAAEALRPIDIATV